MISHFGNHSWFPIQKEFLPREEAMYPPLLEITCRDRWEGAVQDVKMWKTCTITVEEMERVKYDPQQGQTQAK